jgi:PAS domain S-box-containing protein
MFIQEGYFKNIFNTVRDAILILDENMKVLSANRSFFSIFKVDSANTIGALLYDLGNGQWNIPSLRMLLEDILPKNDTVDDYEIKHNFESIGHKTMLLNACKIVAKKNEPPIILLAIEDISERKRLEGLLTESEERFRRLFETASDGIVLLEKHEGKIAHANPSTEKILGYSNKECIGKNLQDIGVALDMRDFSSIIQALNKRGIINYSDVPVKTKSGQYIDADIYMVDRAKLVQCNIRDITERKNTAESLRHRTAELETVNKELGAFIYSAAHDLRAPLRSISGFADIVVKRYGCQLDKKGNDYLLKILKGTERMSNVIDDLLHLSNVSRQEVQRKSVDLSEIVSSVLTSLREAAPGRRVEVIIQESCMVYADPGLMEIAVSNLIGNAWKFTSKTSNACIEFGTIKQHGKTVYFIKDNGAGFEQKYVDRMFQPFHRLHSASEFDGKGIGLAIVDRIIQRHGGNIRAEGKVGKGATIHFTLD